MKLTKFLEWIKSELAVIRKDRLDSVHCGGQDYYRGRRDALRDARIEYINEKRDEKENAS